MHEAATRPTAGDQRTKLDLLKHRSLKEEPQGTKTQPAGAGISGGDSRRPVLQGLEKSQTGFSCCAGTAAARVKNSACDVGE